MKKETKIAQAKNAIEIGEREVKEWRKFLKEAREKLKELEK